MWGINIAGARGLAATLSGWGQSVDEIESLLTDAETLSSLVVPNRSQVASLGRDGTVLATTVDDAADELSGYRLSVGTDIDVPSWLEPLLAAGAAARAMLQEHRHRAHTAQSLIDRIRESTANGAPGDPLDRAALESIFAESIADDDAANSALLLALGGVPALSALQFASMREIDATFDRVHQAMVTGRAPETIDVPLEMFPPGYVEWHTIRLLLEPNAPDLSALGEFDQIGPPPVDLNAILQSIRLAGLSGAEIAIDSNGAVDPVFAASAIGLVNGPVSHEWVGAKLAVELDEWDPANQRAIAGLLPTSTQMSVAFFAELGAQGTAAIPEMLLMNGEAHFDELLLPFAASFAQASGAPELGFTGSEMIAADLNHGQGGLVPDPWATAEFMLIGSGIDSDFLVEAVIESLDVRAQQLQLAPVSRHAQSFSGSDPRLTALQAAAVAGVSAQVIGALAADGNLDLVLVPDSGEPFGRPNPVFEDQVASSFHIFLADAATNSSVARRVIAHIAENAQDYEQRLGDDMFASALSWFLRVSSTAFLGLAQATNHFMFVFDRVLRAGHGLDVAFAQNDLFMRETIRQIQQGRSVDMAQALEFMGTIESIRSAVQTADAAAYDRAAVEFDRLVSVGTGGAGIAIAGAGEFAVIAGSAFFLSGVALALAIGLGVGAIIGSVWGTDADAMRTWALVELEATFTTPRELSQQIALGALLSGNVETESGDPVEIRLHSSTEIEIVVASTGERLYIGNLLTTDDNRAFSFNSFDEIGLWFVQPSQPPIELSNYVGRHDSPAALFHDRTPETTWTTPRLAPYLPVDGEGDGD